MGMPQIFLKKQCMIIEVDWSGEKIRCAHDFYQPDKANERVLRNLILWILKWLSKAKMITLGTNDICHIVKV